MSPINEFKAGRTNKIIGKLYNKSSLNERNVPVKIPIIDDNITIMIDSLNIFL